MRKLLEIVKDNMRYAVKISANNVSTSLFDNPVNLKEVKE